MMNPSLGDRLLYAMRRVRTARAGGVASPVLCLPATGRNLWLPILTHGFSDTIAVAVIFLGLVEM
jgi:hypothetical protein